MPDRMILAVKYTPVSAPAKLRKAVGGFLRYIHYRDKHEQPQPDRQVEGMLKYVAHRDRSSSKGLLFDPSGRIDDAGRRDFAEYVSRSVRATRPLLHRTAGGELADRRRAVYRFVLSPEHAHGLDLQRLSRAAMEQLETDVGGRIRWIAAEHRNTGHPHVHVVMAGIRGAGRRSVPLGHPDQAATGPDEGGGAPGAATATPAAAVGPDPPGTAAGTRSRAGDGAQRGDSEERDSSSGATAAAPPDVNASP